MTLTQIFLFYQKAYKQYINDVKKMRSSTGAVNKLIKDFDSTIEAVITEAERLVKEDKRNTIMEQDIIPTLEKHPKTTSS